MLDIYYLTEISGNPIFFDFLGVYYAAIRLVQGGDLYLYDDISKVPLQSFVYPPPAVVIGLPFVIFEFHTAALTYTIISFTIIITTSLLLVRELKGNKYEMVIAALFMTGFTPTMLLIRNGQVEGIVVGLLTLSALFLIKPQKSNVYGYVSIIILVSLVFVKPYYAPALAPALYKKKWLLTGIVTGIAILLSSILLFGVDAYQSYLIIAKNSEHFRASYEVSKWWSATYRPFYVIGALRYIIHGGVLIGISLICWFSDSLEPSNMFVLGILGILLGSHAPSALTFVVVIPASIILLSNLKRENNIILLILSVSLFFFHTHFYLMRFLLSTVKNSYTVIQSIRSYNPSATARTLRRDIIRHSSRMGYL